MGDALGEAWGEVGTSSSVGCFWVWVCRGGNIIDAGGEGWRRAACEDRGEGEATCEECGACNGACEACELALGCCSGRSYELVGGGERR